MAYRAIQSSDLGCSIPRSELNINGTNQSPAVLQARQDSNIQVVGKTSGLFDGARVRFSSALTGNNISAYYLSDTAIERKTRTRHEETE